MKILFFILFLPLFVVVSFFLWILGLLYSIVKNDGDYRWSYFSEIKLATCAYVLNKPFISPVRNKFEVNLTEFYKELNNSQFIKESPGRFSYEGKNYPIYCLTKKAEGTAKHKVLIISGVHGNEVAGFLCIPKILEDLAKHREIYSNISIEILVPVNPWGIINNSRTNQNNIDINRDFKVFKSNGAKVQKKLIEKFKPDLVIALHEGPQKGFLIISEVNTSKRHAENVVSKVRKAGYSVAPFSYLRFPLRGKGHWKKGKFINFVQKGLNLNMLGTFCDKNNIDNVTIETDWNASLKDRVVLQVKSVKELLNQI